MYQPAFKRPIIAALSDIFLSKKKQNLFTYHLYDDLLKGVNIRAW